MSINCRKYEILAGLLLCAAGAATAHAGNSVLTFTVDMSVQIGAATFIPGTDTVAVRGSFNSFGTLNLVQVGATSVYTNTTTDVADANGGKLEYKFWHNHGLVDNWENTANGQNRCAILPVTSGDSLALPTAFFADAGADTPNQVTFQVDMAQQIHLGTFTGKTVEVQGDFQGWAAGGTLVQVGATTVYTNTFTLTGSPGRMHNFKYIMEPGASYEGPAAVNTDGSNNRFVANMTQTTPLVFFSDQPFVPTETNAVLFQVDMTAQFLEGNFNPATQFVCVNGTFNGWTGGANYLSNNAAGANPYLYTNIISFTNGLGASQQYKFVIFDGVNSTYEGLTAATPQLGGNRFFNMVAGPSLVLGPYYFGETSPNDLLQSSVDVTFSVDMTGAVGTDAYTFTPGTDAVFINGNFLGWWHWGAESGGIQPIPVPEPPGGFFPPPTGYEMTRVGVSSIYTITLTIPQYKPTQLIYKYAINGFKDEAGDGTDHIRYVRSLGSYSTPQDTFRTFTTEQSFGNLAIGAISAGHVPITWLGRPGVHLQKATNLNSGSWTDVNGTDAHSSTNYPVGPSPAYFRLIKP